MLPPEVRALLDQERIIPPVSALRRARAVARARAALAASVVPIAAPSARAPRTRWVAAAAAGLVISAAVGAGAYEIHVRFSPASTLRQPMGMAAPSVGARAPSSAPNPGPTAPAATAPSSSPAFAGRAELHLLRQARAAVARGDFEAALSPIAEHARLFKNGGLIEEREALRVKALVGLGRAKEAHRAAAAFRARFPRSVLLLAVSQMPASAP